MNFDPTFLIALAVAVVALVLFFLARALADRRRERLERRLGGQEEESRTGLLPGSFESSSSSSTERADESFENLIMRTGLDLTSGQALSIVAISGLACGLAILFWRDDYLLAAMGMAVGILIPYGVFLLLRNRRQQQMQNQLPDVFYSFARSLRAGLTLEQVLAQAGTQTPAPIAQEFRLCDARIQLGLRPSAALEMMAERVQLLDFNIFVSTVGLYYTSGGNLAILLDRLAANTRDRNQFQGYFRSSTALSRLSAFVVAAAAPLLLLAYFVFQPTHIGNFLQSPLGWQFIGISMLLEVIGIVWILSLLRVDY